MRKHCFITSCLVAALAAAVPASAQMNRPATRPDRPYRGLFGGGVGTVSQQLVANLSLGGGYDDDLSAEAGGAPSTPSSSPTRRGGPFGSTDAGLGYSLGFEKVQFNANYWMQGRFYRDLPQNFLIGHSLSGGLSWQATERTSVTGNLAVSYQPFYSASFLPPVFDPGLGAPIADDPSISYFRQKYFTRSSGLSATHQISERSSIGASYSHQSNGVVAEEGFATQNYGGSYNHGITKGLTARLGYYVNEAWFADEGQRRRSRFVSLDGGVDYSKSLSLTRKTDLSFSTGTTAVHANGQARYTLIGDVRLTRELGRTWSAGATASRSMQFDPVVRDITITNGISASVGGMINRRLEVHGGVGTSRGSAGFDNPNNGLTFSSASASLMYGVTRYVGLSVQYTYYYSSYQDGVDLPRGWPRTLDRQSFVANVNLFAPLMQRARRPNASR